MRRKSLGPSIEPMSDRNCAKAAGSIGSRLRKAKVETPCAWPDLPGEPAMGSAPTSDKNSVGPNSPAAPSRIGADGLRLLNMARSSASRPPRSGRGRRSLLATTSRSASAIWRALSGRKRKVESPLTASTSVVTPANARRGDRRGSAKRACRIGAGSARPVVSSTTRSKAGSAPEFAARQHVAQRIEQIAAERTAHATAPDEDRVARHPLVKQMVEPDLAPFVDEDQRAGEFRGAQKAIDQRRLACAEKAGDDMKGDRIAPGHD